MLVGSEGQVAAIMNITAVKSQVGSCWYPLQGPQLVICMAPLDLCCPIHEFRLPCYQLDTTG